MTFRWKTVGANRLRVLCKPWETSPQFKWEHFRRQGLSFRKTARYTIKRNKSKLSCCWKKGKSVEKVNETSKGTCDIVLFFQTCSDFYI